MSPVRSICWLAVGLAGALLGLPTQTLSADERPSRAVAPFSAAQAVAFQQAWAKHLQRPVEQPNSIGMIMVVMPPGEFQMGSSAEQIEYAVRWLERIPRVAPGEELRIRNEESPRHQVVLTRPWLVGRTEVTIGQFRQFVSATQYVTETERFGGGNSKRTDETDPVKKMATWQTPGYPVTDHSPVTQITWNDMLEFCRWLSVQEGLTPGYEKNANGDWSRVAAANGYRLPTEAEWEFACRAGTTTHYSFGDDVAQLDHHAWFNRTAEVGREIGARPVATKRPNAFGLFDMHGNVWERCQDFFAPAWYASSPVEDPQGPATGTQRMVRGGGWHYFDLHCRSAYRNNYSPTARTANTGFRIVRPL